jgi:hypothetical protein
MADTRAQAVDEQPSDRRGKSVLPRRARGRTEMRGQRILHTGPVEVVST